MKSSGIVLGCLLYGFAVMADVPAEFRGWSAGKEPEAIGARLVARFLEKTPEKWTDWKGTLSYPVACAWYGAFEFADARGDSALGARLAELYEPFEGRLKSFVPAPCHVDFTMFGCIPISAYLHSGDRVALRTGLAMADAQWKEPKEGDNVFNGMFDLAERTRLWKAGLTPQTRFWIDDMFMITIVQLKAFQATGDRKYADRASREMVQYLDKLQNPDGLFYHAPDVPFVWGRGDGWMASGTAMLLKALPEDNADRPRILAGYRKMMAALLKHQKSNGMWGQLVDDPNAWDETSGTAMFAYAFIEGVKHGWLDAATYAPAARRAYLALCDYLTEQGDVREVCVGTNKKNDHQYYLDRKRETGNLHGQAPLLWCCAALAEKAKPQADAWRPYLKPAVDFLKFLPQALTTCKADPSLKFYGTGHAGHWAVQCSQQVASGLAILSTVPDADLAAAGSPYTAAQLRDLALALFRYSWRTHLTGDLPCAGGDQKWGRHWISVLGLERSCGGLNLLEPYFTDDDRARLRNMLVFESDYRLEKYPINAAIYGGSGKNVPESNIWNAGTMYRTAFNYPDIPQRDGYLRKARKMMLNGLSYPGDADEPWYVGPNFTENWSLDHHAYMNVGYSYESFSNLAFLYFNFLERGQPVPPELISHARDLWRVCKGFTFPDGRLNRIGGDTRFRYGYCQIFAYQCWAFCAHALGDADCERYAREYLKKIVAEQALNGDGSFFGKRLKGIRDASWYYYCRAEADPFFTMCYQLKWHRDHAFPKAEGSVATAPSYTWTDGFHRAAYVKTPKSVRSVVGRAQWGRNHSSRKPNITVAPTDASDLAEWQANLVGFVGYQEEADEFKDDPANWPKDAFAQRVYKDAGGDAFDWACTLPMRDNYVYGEGESPYVSGTRRMRVHALGDGATLVVRDRVTIERAVSLEHGFRALHWLVPNDFANGFTRTFEGRTFKQTYTGAPAKDEMIATGERVLTVDGRMSVIAVKGADLSIRRPAASEIAFRRYSGDQLHLLSSLRAEEVVMDYQLDSIRPKAGDTLYDVVYVVSVSDAASARKLADSVKLDGEKIVLTGLDGIVRTLEL